jgi:NAD(P)H-hydrate epimerase
MQVVTVEQMRSIEQAADSQGLTYATMMENAGRAVAAWLEGLGISGQHIVVLVGPGNNGGDGLVAAYYLHQAGAHVAVYCWKRDVTNDENWKRVESAGILTIWSEQDERYTRLKRLVAEADWIVDALLGTGVSKPITGSLQEILGVVSKSIAKRRGDKKVESFVRVLPATSQLRVDSKPQVLALDVPSGLNCDTGAVDPATLPADVTVTLAFPKVGLFLFPGAIMSGQLVVADIGIPAELAKGITLRVSTPDWIRTFLPRRPLDAHKGTFGKVMVVGGSVNYSGAPCLAASAAMRVGAGLVTLGIAEMLHPILAAKVSEATFLLLPHQLGALVPEAVKVLEKSLTGYDALLLGPGLGRDEQTIEFVARLLDLPLGERRARLGFLGATSVEGESRLTLPPVVIDADGLNALATLKGWAQHLPPSAVLTPHPGEMARLLNTAVAEVNAHRIELARQAAKEWGVVVLLKGAYTVIASPEGSTYINPFATPALATAGTGDVLAGAVAGFLAQGLNPFEAAVVGAYVHGLAGQMVSAEIGPAGAVASDLLSKLPLSLKSLAGR